MEPFKNFIDATLVRSIGTHLQRVDRRFARRDFEAAALDGLETLELKDRVRQVAQALVMTLPDDVDRACALMEATLGPPGDAEDLSTQRSSDAGLGGWAIWPLTEAVSRIALDEPERGLAALHAMTQRSSAEFAIRPFLLRHPDVCWPTLARWVHDPSAHVRRLVSEGSRPRLPWGLRLQPLVQDPTPTLPLLEALQDDRSAYVRRSVANHLNDIAKDHPALVAGWLSRHLPGASADRTALLRHASRGLIKGGDAAVLAAWGLGQKFKGDVAFSISPGRAHLGDALELVLDLHSRSAKPQRLAIDYAVHHVKADGRLTPKVFKGWLIELGAREQRRLARRHSLKVVTTRRYHAGRHVIDLRINGQVLAEAAFELRL